ncbi:MAG TPA: metal-dependent hydrolase [Thermomicrobiales bacterium]|nr:metal-dependent hydrolase [Thermomicrobiales bacterium]
MTASQQPTTEQPPITLRYIGHSAFTLESNGKLLAIDPFITGNPSSTIQVEDIEPTTILVTHAHDDHVGDTVKLADRTGAPVVAQVELSSYLSSKGCETITPNYGGTAKFDGGTVKLTPAWHTSSHSEGGPLGQPAGMIVRFGGKTFYFAGDTALFLDMQLIGDEGIDVAILPIGDFFTMGPDDAVRAAKFVRPKHVVPCHYNTFPPIQQDPEEFKKKLEEQTTSKCVILQPGEAWVVE